MGADSFAGFRLRMQAIHEECLKTRTHGRHLVTEYAIRARDRLASRPTLVAAEKAFTENIGQGSRISFLAIALDVQFL